MPSRCIASVKKLVVSPCGRLCVPGFEVEELAAQGGGQCCVATSDVSIVAVLCSSKS